MTAFQPELPELPAVRVCRDRFAVQGKNRRVEEMPIPSALTKDSFSVQSRKKDSSGTGLSSTNRDSSGEKERCSTPGRRGRMDSQSTPRTASEMPHAASPRQWLRLKQISGCAGK